MTGIRFVAAIALFGILAACSGRDVWAPDDAVARAAYVHNGPPTITLVTVVGNEGGGGGHSSLVINGQQRVVFDPAGNFKHEAAPERNDFVYGMYPGMLRAYYGFHARVEWHVVTQEIEVTPEVAEQAYQLTKNYGSVPQAFCANSVSHILGKTSGFETISRTFSPIKLMAQFAEFQNVKTDKIYEYD